MNEKEKELYIARIRGSMDDDTVRNWILEKKRLLLANAERENWNRVMKLAEELSILQEEYVSRLDGRFFNYDFHQ